MRFNLLVKKKVSLACHCMCILSMDRFTIYSNTISFSVVINMICFLDQVLLNRISLTESN